MKILFVSLGCDKNLVDTEMMLGMLTDKGYFITNDENEADVVVINTCCFINDAKEESINTILEMAELKKSGKMKALLVAGCLAQRYKEEIQEEIPEVDAIIGTTAPFAPLAHIRYSISRPERKASVTAFLPQIISLCKLLSILLMILIFFYSINYNIILY